MQQSTACSPCTPYWGTVTLDTETGEYTEELGSETGEYSEELESETGEFTEELERADQRNTDKKMNHKGGGGMEAATHPYFTLLLQVGPLLSYK